MVTKIGIVAGEIWNILDQKGEISLSELAAELHHPKEVIHMSLGWLARESHVTVTESKGDFKVRLR